MTTAESPFSLPSSELLELRRQELEGLIDDPDILKQFGSIIDSRKRAETLGGSMRARVVGGENETFCERLANLDKAGLYKVIYEYTARELGSASMELQNANGNGRTSNGERQRGLAEYEGYKNGVAEGTALLNRPDLPVEVRVYMARATELFRGQRDETVVASRLKQIEDLRNKIAFLSTVQTKLLGHLEAKEEVKQTEPQLVHA